MQSARCRNWAERPLVNPGDELKRIMAAGRGEKLSAIGLANTDAIRVLVGTGDEVRRSAKAEPSEDRSHSAETKQKELTSEA